MCYNDWGIHSSSYLFWYAILWLVVNYAKGRARHIPPQTDTVVRFPPEHVARFLRLCNLGNNEGHKICYI